MFTHLHWFFPIHRTISSEPESCPISTSPSQNSREYWRCWTVKMTHFTQIHIRALVKPVIQDFSKLHSFRIVLTGLNIFLMFFKKVMTFFFWVPPVSDLITDDNFITQYQFSSVQSLSCVRLFATPWIAAGQASLSISNSWSSLRLTYASQWCHPAISSSVDPFSSCPQSLPASESFPMSQLFEWGGQRTGVSALASIIPKKSHGWSPSEWTGWISLQSKGLSRVFSNTTVQSINSSALSFLHSPTLTSIHDHRKNHSLD